ncbi:MAG: AAA family ATPase [Gemmatimonadota bacterium]|nr:AAA family ATPase [Gemmatimonadota bacterium]
MYLRTLGESVIEVGEARIGPSAPHMFAALLYLALESGRRVPRARLQELLFPTSDERSGSHSLRQLLYRIRRLGVELNCDAAGVLLPASLVAADFQRFLTPTSGRRADLGDVAAGFLVSYAPNISHGFGDWLEQRRAEVLARIRRTLTAELVGHRAGGRWEACEETARALLAIDPLNEEATLARAEAMALYGAKADAVHLLDSYLTELGSHGQALRLPATVLRSRIADRLVSLPSPASGRFVGRSMYLERLHDLLNAAKAGSGSACHICGEAGIGKTRLVSEFARSAILDGVVVEQVSFQPHDIRRPMGAFTDLVPSLLRLPGALGCSPEAVSFLTRLFRLEGQAAGPLSQDVREAELLSANITRAISELLDAVTAESIVVLVIEDAQWSDAISLRVLEDLVAEHKSRPLILVFTSRGAGLGISTGEVSRPITLRLQPLTGDESNALLADLLKRGGVVPDSKLTAWCLSIASGNPLFLHSVAAHYAATRDRTAIPEPLQALLAHRFSVLDRRTRRIFEACAVLGRHATFERIEAVVGLSTYDLLGGLQALEEHGFVTCEGSRVLSTHVLLTEMALKQAPHTVRMLLHYNAARTLENEFGAQRSATTLWDCAEHWLQAGDAQRSIEALRQCSRHALAIGRPDDATEALLRARDLLSGPEERLVVLDELVAAAVTAGKWALALESALAYRGLIEQGGRTVPAEHEYRLIELEARARTGEPLLDLVQPALNYIDTHGALPSRKLRACILLLSVAEATLADGLAARAYSVAASIPVEDDATTAQRLMLDMLFHATFGDLDIAAELAGTRVQMCTARATLPAACYLRGLASMALLRAGHFGPGRVEAETCYHEAATAGLNTYRLRAASILACFLRDCGEASAAREWHAKATQTADRLHPREVTVSYVSNAVLFALDDGDFRLAATWLERARRDFAEATVGHARLHFSAVELRIRQLCGGRRSSETDVQALLEAHLHWRGFGHHDEVAEALWHELAECGRQSYADTLLADYLTSHRRLRWPLSPGLRSLAADRLTDNCWHRFSIGREASSPSRYNASDADRGSRPHADVDLA